MDKSLFDRISIDPNICGGKPVIRGTRIWVSNILDLLSNGCSYDEILSNYPGISNEDLSSCIKFAAYLSRVNLVDLPDAA